MSPPDPSSANPPVALSPTARAILSLAIAAWLGLVVLGPLSNPIASANLTEPLARLLRPLYQALFLGHGYRFFGPEPGPSHIVQYKIGLDDGEVLEGHFPDTESSTGWPRLRYHRWFMLSETLFREVNLPSEEEQQQILENLDGEIEHFRLQGEAATVRRLVAERNGLDTSYRNARARSRELLQGIARFLLEQHSGKTIELALQERRIAHPADVASHVELDDPRFLSEPRVIGKFTRKELLPQEENR